MNLDPMQRRILVVGGTGMLSPLCQALPPDQLIVAARFQSNTAKVALLPKDVLRVPLDYTHDSSIAAFMSRLADWHNIACCVLWVHSPAHGFSRALIETLSQREVPPQVVHLFGSNVLPEALIQWAKQYHVPFTAVQLGHVDLPGGWRWLTDSEISQQTARALVDTYPNLHIKSNLD